MWMCQKIDYSGDSHFHPHLCLSGVERIFPQRLRAGSGVQLLQGGLKIIIYSIVRDSTYVTVIVGVQHCGRDVPCWGNKGDEPN